MTAYVLDAASAGFFDGVAQPFDYSQAAAFFVPSFLLVLILYFSTRIYGEIDGMLRRS